MNNEGDAKHPILLLRLRRSEIASRIMRSRCRRHGLRIFRARTCGTCFVRARSSSPQKVCGLFGDPQIRQVKGMLRIH